MKTSVLRKILDYNPDTGEFRAKVHISDKLRAGASVGYDHSGGYRQTMLFKKRYYLHRLAWQYVHGKVPPHQIDHINGDRADNRIENLRLAKQQNNSANMKRRPNNRSGFKGVSRSGNGLGWVAYIHVDGKTNYLGTFASKRLAHLAYCKAAHLHFGSFARAG